MGKHRTRDEAVWVAQCNANWFGNDYVVHSYCGDWWVDPMGTFSNGLPEGAEIFFPQHVAAEFCCIFFEEWWVTVFPDGIAKGDFKTLEEASNYGLDRFKLDRKYFDVNEHPGIVRYTRVFSPRI